MKWELATEEQLLQVCSEDCPVELKYRAASELQDRKYRPKSNDHLKNIVLLFGKGFLISEIAQVVGLSDYRVQKTIEKYGLWKVRLYNELRRTDSTSNGTSYSYFNGKRVL